MKTINIEDVEIGEEYTDGKYVYLKLTEDEGAIILDTETGTWKVPTVEH